MAAFETIDSLGAKNSEDKSQHASSFLVESGCESSEGPEPPCFCANHLQGAWWWDSGPRIISTELAGLSAKLASHPCSLAISADEHCKRNGQWRRQTGRLGRSYVTKATDLRANATCFALRGRRGSGVRRSEGEKA